MLVVGSQAMKHHFPEAGIIPRDTDIIGTMDEFREWSRTFAKGDIIICKPLSATKMHVRTKDGWNYEFEIATAGSSSERLLDYFDLGQTYAPTWVLLFLKMSHRFRRNSPHFLKTMRDIQFLRAAGVTMGTELEELLPQREAETYTYAHPKLDVSKSAFFDGDGVPYIYDHDSIHLTQALCVRQRWVRTGGPSVAGKLVSYGKEETIHTPAYTFYMKEGSEVMTSKEKFFSMPESIRLAGVYEESCVLALERSQIPFPEASPRKSFEYALMKVCTSITSGWFREFAWENYDNVLDIYEKEGEDGYLKRFNANKHLLKPYEGSY
jgi:hypothetical protein